MILIEIPIIGDYNSWEMSRAKHRFEREEEYLKEKIRLISELGIIVSMGLAILLVCFI